MKYVVGSGDMMLCYIIILLGECSVPLLEGCSQHSLSNKAR